MTEDDMKENAPGAEDYDGIRVCDHPVPPWWKWLFVITIGYGMAFLLWHFITGGSTARDAYEAALAAQAEQRTTAYGELVADEATILGHIDDEAAMAGMAGLFKSKCAQCHRPDGGGSIGPNLTDDAWIRVTRVTDIARIIGEGVAVKGMPGWEGMLTPTQIVLLSSYVARLQRHPAFDGKKAEGEVVAPWPRAAPAPPGRAQRRSGAALQCRRREYGGDRR